MMKFSLIVPTIYRVQETERLFQSLIAQDYENFEVIVVDQNPDERLSNLIDHYGHQFPIVHLRESVPGQSRARNIGFSHVSGDIVAFPDDDCVYPDGLLTQISQFFRHYPQWDGVVGRVYDLDEDTNAFEGCGDAQSQALDYPKAYKVCVSCAIFFRKTVAQEVSFNETLGPGAGTPWGCGDETDFIFKCLDKGYRFYYDASLRVRHPNPQQQNPFLNQVRREYGYGMGKGYFLATHSLPASLSRTERYIPFQMAQSEIQKGRWHRASYFFVNGIGTMLGYLSGKNKMTHKQVTAQP